MPKKVAIIQERRDLDAVVEGSMFFRNKSSLQRFAVLMSLQ
jgi:hypothetical protein